MSEGFLLGIAIAICSTTFLLSAGIEMTLMLYNIRKKGYYETRKWKYTRVRK